MPVSTGSSNACHHVVLTSAVGVLGAPRQPDGGTTVASGGGSGRGPATRTTRRFSSRSVTRTAWNPRARATFATVLKAKLPRYAGPIAVTESFFVAKAHRRTGAGLELLRAGEDKARALGCPGLLVSALACG